MEKTKLFSGIDKTVTELLDLVFYLDADKINTVPYKDSWTAAQLLRHVTKSTVAMAKGMDAPGKPPEREPDARVAELEKVFLDFSTKLNAPDFIVPEEGTYEKDRSMQELKTAFDKLKENANKADLNTLLEGLPLGPITKLEILHFSLYHTQRHLQQMKRIVEAL